MPQPIPDRRSESRSGGGGPRPIAIVLAMSLILGFIAAVARSEGAGAATVGAGSYTTTLPAGQKLPAGCGDMSTNPRQAVTSNAPEGPVPTNDWWTSILWKRTNDCAFGEPLFAHPAAYDTEAGGLGHLVRDHPGRDRQPDRHFGVQVPLHP